MLNAPYNGGTHLPDITVVTPVFGENSPDLLFFVAARGHHADIGGIAPGSMSPRATRIEEEGVYIDPFKLVARGRFREDAVLRAADECPLPRAEPRAEHRRPQGASRRQREGRGRARARWCGITGSPTVRAYMGHVQDNAAEAVSRVIAKLKNSRFEVETDQGSVIKVAIKIDKKARKATVDFTGTSAQVANAFNAPEPITRACVLYVFRTLVDEEIPLNAGCLRPIKIVVPKGSMLKPRYPAAGRRRQCGDQPDHRRIASMARSACSARRKAR